MSSPGPSPDPSDPPDSPDRPDPLPDPGSGPPSPLLWLVRSDLGSGVTLAIGTLLIHRCATLFNLGDYVWVAVFAFIAAVLALHLWWPAGFSACRSDPPGGPAPEPGPFRSWTADSASAPACARK